MSRKIFMNFMLLVSMPIVISSCAGISKPKTDAQVFIKEEYEANPLTAKEAVAQPVIELSPRISHPVLEPEIQIGAKEKVGTQIPHFSLNDLQGKNVSLSDFKGKSVVLFFWATWCPYCTEELPDLQKRYKDIVDAGIEILAIDIGEPQARVEKFLSKNAIDFPVLLDRKNEVASSYRVVGIPTYVLIGQDGEIKFRGNILPKDYIQILTQK